MYAANKNFVKDKRDVLVRFAMAYLQGVKEFDAAAKAPDPIKEILEILAKNTFLNKPELIKAIAPYWSYTSEDGIPPIDLILAMQDYWSDYFNYVEKKASREQLFDLSVAQEAKSGSMPKRLLGNNRLRRADNRVVRKSPAELAGPMH